MKKIQVIIYSALFFIACSPGAANEKINYKDSIYYTQPVAGNLSEKDSIKYYNAIEGFYDSTLLRSGFNGAILVAKKGHVIFEKYHGYFNLEKKDSLNEHSAFHLASVSKTFTAMAILKLAEQGKLKLDDDVKNYFPEFPYNGITIKMLLNHRSGLPNYLYFMQQLGWDVKQYCNNNDVVNYLIKYQPPLTHLPNTHFSYCNTNYSLLGLIIEKASGKSYSEFLQHSFFTPLKMSDTYVFTMKDSARAMPSYDWRGRRERLSFLDVGFGDKNIYSTARDLLKWDQAMYNNQIFSNQTLEEAFTPYSNEKPGIKNYGYGWRMNIYPNGKKIIFHGGWWHGNNTMLMRLIQDSVTIIILGNKYNRNIYQAKKLANIFSPYFDTYEEERPENSTESPAANNKPVNKNKTKKL
ncbi:MAG: beta-lactamase family protein [Bacteroidota bacterium]|nr:beta-lactamase family protein [Bacteroidota bacterium]